MLPPSPPRAAPIKRVLFVDDDDLMRQAFVGAMREFDYEVDTAASGAEAVARVRGRAYPVVVTDLRMPGIDGIALIEQLNTIRPDTAFVLVSGDPYPNIVKNERVDAAIASVIAKPIDIDDLARTLDHAFGFHKKRVAAQWRVRKSEPASEHVLLVEDNPSDVQLITEMLRDQPLRSVGRLSEALRSIHDEHFEVIMTDVALPDARGIDAVMRLQASAPEAVIIVISSFDDDALAHQVIQLGAQDYLLKQTLARRALLRAISFARERKRAEQQLVQLAHYDQLTGLSNRTSFFDNMTRVVSRARRMNQRAGVLVLDLDGFKSVNDTYGHDAGDTLLQEVSHRMRTVFREYDVVARMGGDEFAVLLTEVDDLVRLSGAAQRLLTVIAAPIDCGGARVEISASIGIAVFPDSAESIAELLKCADSAMYEAKRAGKNGFKLQLGSGAPPRMSSPPPVSDIRGVLGVRSLRPRAVEK